MSTAATSAGPAVEVISSSGGQRFTVTLPWAEWQEMLAVIPDGPLRSKLVDIEKTGISIDRPRIAEALKAGHTVPGARLIRRQHVRFT